MGLRKPTDPEDIPDVLRFCIPPYAGSHALLNREPAGDVPKTGIMILLLDAATKHARKEERSHHPQHPFLSLGFQ